MSNETTIQFDGVQVPATKVTMVKLDCGDVDIVQGWGHKIGAYAECPEHCTHDQTLGSTIAEVFETVTVDVTSA